MAGGFNGRWRAVLVVVLLSLYQSPLRAQRDQPLLKIEYLTEHQEYGLGAEEVHLQVRVRVSAG